MHGLVLHMALDVTGVVPCEPVTTSARQVVLDVFTFFDLIRREFKESRQLTVHQGHACMRKIAEHPRERPQMEAAVQGKAAPRKQGREIELAPESLSAAG